MGTTSLLASWWQNIIDFIVGFFACIPQLMYFLYTCCASLLDFLQYLIRKLAGLDVYYVEGSAVSGDIVLSFVRGILGIDKSPAYSSLSTVFWSLVIFGCILLVLSTIFSIIKAHYNYDAKKSHPMTIIMSSIKSLCLMAIVPIVAIFGLYLSQILLQALDEITSTGTTTISSEVASSEFTNVFQAGYANSKVAEGAEGEIDPDQLGVKTYANYDFFGSLNYTSTVTFSGVMFKTAAYECNRVRIGSYTAPTSKEGGSWDNFKVFFSEASNPDTRKEEVAMQIDYAFANALRVKEGHNVTFDDGESFAAMGSSFASPYSAVAALGLINVTCFSKYNVGLVWYYYNLWAFNFLLAFAGITAFLVILGNITFGMITRMIQLLALFFVFPPLIGIAPLDDGNSFKKWRQQFISDTLMAFGAIVGMNIFFLILPFLNSISFFNIKILDYIMNIIIMLAGMTMVAKFISLISGFIGAGDANKTGEETRKATTDLASKGLQKTMKAATLGVKFAGGNLALTGAKTLFSTVGESKFGKAVKSVITPSGRKARWANKLEAEGLKSEEAIYKENVALEEEKLGRKLKDGEKKKVSQKTREQYENQFNTLPDENKIKKTHNRHKAVAKVANAALIPFGASFNKVNGEFDGIGNLRAFGNAVVDISKLGFKVVGDVSGYSKMKKGMDDRGDTDSIKSFFQTVVGDKSKSMKMLQTKKDKDDSEKSKVAQERADIGDISTNTKLVADAITNLVNKISSMP